MKTSPNFDAFLQKMRDALPHAGFIREQDARAWWESLDADKFNDEDWHLRRLRKIGGSESGVLVAPIYDEPPPFDQTPAHIFDRKMMRGVLEQNDAMRFGHEHEPVARKLYEERLFTMGWTRDEEGMRQLSAFVASDADGSMAYSPDDMFVLMNPDGTVQKRLLPDYKSPYSGHVPGLRGGKDGPGFSYVVQLHHGLEVCRRAGLQVDELRLCFLDHPDNLAKPKAARLMVMQIQKDPDLVAQITECCDSMMRNVRVGHRPLPINIRVNSTEPETSAALSALVRMQKDLVALVREEKSLGDRLKSVRENMARQALELLPPGKGIDAEEWGLKVIPKIAYKVTKGSDEKLMTILAEAFQLQSDVAEVPAAARKNPYITMATDTDKLAKFLESHGKSFDDFQMPVAPNMSAISGNKPLLCDLLAEGVAETNISFAVPSKLNVEDLEDLAEDAHPSAPSFRALLWHPESSDLWEETHPEDYESAMNDGLVSDVTGIQVYEEAFAAGTIPNPGTLYGLQPEEPAREAQPEKVQAAAADTPQETAATASSDASAGKDASKAPRKPRGRKAAPVTREKQGVAAKTGAEQAKDTSYVIAMTIEDALSRRFAAGPFATMEEAVAFDDGLIFMVDQSGDMRRIHPGNDAGQEKLLPASAAEEPGSSGSAPVDFAELDEDDDIFVGREAPAEAMASVSPGMR